MSWRKYSKVRAWVCLLATLGGLSQGQDAGALVAARAALDDGMPDIAQKQCEAFLKSDHLSALQRGDATVLLARALYGQSRYRDMLKVLTDSEGALTTDPGALVYWRAVACYETGDASLAQRQLVDFDSRFRNSSLVAAAARLVAWCNLREKKVPEALQVFAQYDRQFGSSTEGAVNLLDWGQALMQVGDFMGAQAVFERLTKRDPGLSAVQDGKLWLARAMISNGKWEGAWNLLNLVANDEMVRIDRRSLACMILSEVNAVQTNLEAAVNSAARGAELAPTTYLKNRGKALQGRWLLRSGKLAAGAQLLRPVIAGLADDPIAKELQLELASAYAVAKMPDKAAEEYQYYLETFSDPAGRYQAYRGRGSALWDVQRYAEASAMFEKAAVLAGDSKSKEELLIKSADALFANSQYQLAGAAYERLLVDYPADALTPQVLYQVGDCLAHQSLWSDAESRFRELVRRYPNDPLAERALLRIAENKEDQGPTLLPAAMAAYADVMNVYPSGRYFPEALHRHGLVAYQMGDIDMALKDFTRVVNDFPKARVAPHAYFMRGWALYMRGQEEESLKVCTSFVERYPDSEWTPGVIFWLGEYAYNHGQYGSAETQFLSLVDKFPKDTLADQALIWAGRSAMMHKEYLRAVDTFSKLAKSYPGSSRLDEARFLQGDSLSELGEFSRAILVFDDLLAKYPNSNLASAAWGRRGDCQFTLGATDPKRYEEAVNSYRSVARSPGSTFDLELQAEYKIGRCYEKLGRKKDAFEQYYTRVIVVYLAAKDTDPASAVWFTKASFSAADIMEAEKNWKRAVKILERVVEANIPASGDARKRIEQIRSDHWIL